MDNQLAYSPCKPGTEKKRDDYNKKKRGLRSEKWEDNVWESCSLIVWAYLSGSPTLRYHSPK